MINEQVLILRFSIIFMLEIRNILIQRSKFVRVKNKVTVGFVF